MRKHAFILLLLLSTLASGCVTVHMETKIKQDGSGTKSFVLALDNSVMSMIESMAQESGAGPDDVWETARAGAESISGARVEDYRDDESQGIKITVPFSDLNELQALSGVDAFAGSDVVTVSQNGAITTLKATVKTGDLAAGFDDLEGFDLGDIDIEYAYSVKVEGVILAYAPTGNAVTEGNKVTWDLTQSTGDTTELMIEWDPSSGSDVRVILLVVIAPGGAALIVVGVILIARGKRAPDQRRLEKG
jgi:hypothetical protein